MLYVNYISIKLGKKRVLWRNWILEALHSCTRFTVRDGIWCKTKNTMIKWKSRSSKVRLSAPFSCLDPSMLADKHVTNPQRSNYSVLPWRKCRDPEESSQWSPQWITTPALQASSQLFSSSLLTYNGEPRITSYLTIVINEENRDQNKLIGKRAQRKQS